MSHQPRRIAIAVFDGVESLDVTGPAQVFSTASRLLDRSGRGYTVELVGAGPAPVHCAGGVRLLADRTFADSDGEGVDTLVVPGGLRIRPEGVDAVVEAVIDPEVLAWVARVAPRVRRVVSVCAGAHTLAAAGLLTGRRATTHWATAEALAERHPDVTVDADAVYVRSGPVWTGAGVSAGIDMSLALVADDHGRRHALATAKWMVRYLQRPGDQSQFSAPLKRQSTARTDIAELLAWIDAHLAERLTVPDLAARMGLGERQFARVFLRETGSTPATYLDAQRVHAARRLLQESDLTVAAIGARCGFGSVHSFHRAFKRHTSVTPQVYRRHFTSAAAPVPAVTPQETRSIWSSRRTRRTGSLRSCATPSPARPGSSPTAPPPC
ncbi:DJ-1/PfpI family protein [Streptomyces sp. NPDC018338]|uniref:GlxA family transcriptional regulator n=1 Tax=Streptomyces sp. NPDC018338 TaxID=3157192 RepID=UPI0033CE3098